MTADPPATNSFKDCNSMKDIGVRLLASVGVSEPTDQQIDLAVIANDVFVSTLEKIRDNAPNKERLQ
jgi:hypothetical protein